jgi:ribosome biogenesis GTPase / thiamine phosphate phosphatase
MSKRKLSKQQQSRIHENQRRELHDSDQPAEIRDSADSTEGARENCNGRVVSHYGQQLDVETLEVSGNRIVRCKQRANLPSLVTGDLVVWEQDESGGGVILARGHRSNVFGRHDSRGKLKPVAANIDLVLLVIASEPIPHLSLIDRYLVAIENLNLTPLLILNKVDLLDENNQGKLDNILSIYEEIGYRPHRVSALTDSGIADLEADLQDLTTVLVGQSGVGKSSLLNRLAGGELAAVGELSEAHQQGIHTTTTSKLFHLENFDLIDSPGIREFNLDFVSPVSVFEGFVEFVPYRGLCKFRDCAHRTEPGCALIQSVQDGKIRQTRLESYYRILDSEE